MVKTDELVTLIRSHVNNDDEMFRRVALQISQHKYFKDSHKILYLDTITLNIDNVDGLSLFSNGDFSIM